MVFQKGLIPWNKGKEGLKGRLVSEETRRKLSLANKGRKLTEEHRVRLSESHRGQIAWNKGINLTEKHKKNLSLGKLGKHINKKFGIYSEEKKRRIVRAQSGKFPMKDYCEICKEKNVELQRHHWSYDNTKPNTFDKFNTLCTTCHKIQHIKDFEHSKYAGGNNFVS